MLNKCFKKSLVCVFGVVFVFCLCGFYLASNTFRSAEKPYSPAPAVKHPQEAFETVGEKYFLTVSDGKICAYRISNGSRELVNMSYIDLELISAEDIKTLSNGIYADSFEEMCLYFESYAS